MGTAAVRRIGRGSRFRSTGSPCVRPPHRDRWARSPRRRPPATARRAPRHRDWRAPRPPRQRRPDRHAAAPSLGQHARRAKHGRHAALHVLRAATVQASISVHRSKRRVHPRHAHRVDVTVEHQRRSGRPPFEHRDDVGAAGRDLGDIDGEAGSGALGGDSPRRLRLPSRAGNQRWVHRIDRIQVFEELNRGIRTSG